MCYQDQELEEEALNWKMRSSSRSWCLSRERYECICAGRFSTASLIFGWILDGWMDVERDTRRARWKNRSLIGDPWRPAATTISLRASCVSELNTILLFARLPPLGDRAEVAESWKGQVSALTNLTGRSGECCLGNVVRRYAPQFPWRIHGIASNNGLRCAGT